MDEDKFALVEKILKDVDNIITKNAELYSFDIVPSETNLQNKSPVLHFENCLGLESWCVKHVYMYCYSELMDKYLTNSKRKPLRVSSINSGRLSKLLNIVLLLNPDLSTLWNKRREMVDKLLLDKQSELRFAKLALSRKPKANDAFAYRRWLLDALKGDIESVNIESVVNEELNICVLASEKCLNNYHSWNHRIWLINYLKRLSCTFNLSSLYIKEYIFSERWMSKHVSDYCCYHYRQFCIKNIFFLNTESWKIFETSIDDNLRKSFVAIIATNFPDGSTIQASQENLISYSDEKLVNVFLSNTFKKCSCNLNNSLVCRKFEILFHELMLNNEFLRFYKHHETLWYHRRFVIHEILEVIYEYFGLVKQKSALVKKPCAKCSCDQLKQAKIVKYDVSQIYNCCLFKILMCHEKKFIGERQLDGDNYSDRHDKYLKFIKGFNN